MYDIPIYVAGQRQGHEVFGEKQAYAAAGGVVKMPDGSISTFTRTEVEADWKKTFARPGRQNTLRQMSTSRIKPPAVLFLDGQRAGFENIPRKFLATDEAKGKLQRF